MLPFFCGEIMYLSLILLVRRDGNNRETLCSPDLVPFERRVKGHVESPGPSLSVYFFSHNRSMKGIIMRELFGPVSTNVNWYNGGARRYNKKKGEGRGNVKVLSRFSNKVWYKEPQRFHANAMQVQPVSI